MSKPFIYLQLKVKLIKNNDGFATAFLFQLVYVCGKKLCLQKFQVNVVYVPKLKTFCLRYIYIILIE